MVPWHECKMLVPSITEYSKGKEPQDYPQSPGGEGNVGRGVVLQLLSARGGVGPPQHIVGGGWMQGPALVSLVTPLHGWRTSM